MQSYIHNIKTYQGKLINQQQAVEWLISYHGEKHRDLFLRYAVSEKDIRTRQVFASGVLDADREHDPLYAISEDNRPSLNLRSQHAQNKIDEIFSKLYANEKSPPNHLNHVSCSHYQSPSGAQQLVAEKNWCEYTSVTHLYHMGCYASMPAIRVSDAYVAQEAMTVDVVHTELCTFHLDKEDVTPEQIIMKTLFADGAIKYSLSPKDFFESFGQDGFELLCQKEVIVPNTENEMTWKLGSHGFIMTLTRKVPVILSRNIKKFMRDLLEMAGSSIDEDKEDIIFAIHPGGPKIIELVQKVLELNHRQVNHSKTILETRGNMSSATLPHIWNNILEDQDVKSDTLIASVAFGPGLTMTGAVFRLCRK